MPEEYAGIVRMVRHESDPGYRQGRKEKLVTERATSRQSLFPVILYRDVTAAIEWLEKAFGFETLMSVPNEDGTIAHAEIRYAGEVIMLGTTQGSPGDPPWRGVYVCVDDIEAHHARAVAAGARIERELADTDYGSRDYSACDLEGYIWHFGTYRP